MSGKLDSNPGSQVPRFHSHLLIVFYQCDLRNRVGWLGTWRAPPNTLLQGIGTEEPTFISKSLPQGRSKAPSARKVTSPLFPHLPLPQTNQLGLASSGPSLHGGLGKQLSVGPGLAEAWTHLRASHTQPKGLALGPSCSHLFSVLCSFTRVGNKERNHPDHILLMMGARSQQGSGPSLGAQTPQESGSTADHPGFVWVRVPYT